VYYEILLVKNNHHQGKIYDKDYIGKTS